MPFVTSCPSHVNHARQGGAKRRAKRKKRNGPGHHVMACPGRPAFGLAADLARRRGGLLLGSRGVGPLLPGPRRVAEATATSTRATTTVRCQRTSLRTLSRMRATTFTHFAFPPPACRRPRAQRTEPPPRADVSSWGVEVRFRQGDPGSMLRLRRSSSAGPIRDVMPQRGVSSESNTQRRMRQGPGTILRAPIAAVPELCRWARLRAPRRQRAAADVSEPETSYWTSHGRASKSPPDAVV